jgi:hypothetical protein
MKTLGHPPDAAELVQRLRTLRAESAARWGRMTAPQMICHVGDALRMALGEQPVSDGSAPLLRTIVKWIALYVPLAWPAGLLTRPEIDQVAGGGTRPGEFARDVAQVEALLTLVASARSDSWPIHPIFGRLSHNAWLRWAYLHTDHHLRQFGA